MCGGVKITARKLKSIIMSQTLGQKRVKADFNPSKTEKVDELKRGSAEMIDTLESMRGDGSGERQRLISLAQTACEEAAMWAVKANFTD